MIQKLRICISGYKEQVKEVGATGRKGLKGKKGLKGRKGLKGKKGLKGRKVKSLLYL